MIDQLIAFSIKNKLIIGLLILALCIWGGYSLQQLPIDAVPDITNNQVQVMTVSPSLAAEDVERLITFPVEIIMATIPEIDEIRSFSRFGLSVVTIVFQENVDVYWARQQVGERLTQVLDQIPKGIGKPEMAPITTGLGEIYQYVVGTLPGYEDDYNARELRTIQDWIVKRQLLGTKGVADVSSFGGHLKQYEVAVDPNQLKAMGVSLADVFVALKDNNENTGGAYIEKRMNAYFIRTEGLVETLDDIRSIPVKTSIKGIPILVRDVANVQVGSAVRYGATTRNGEGEVVSAIVMMLKGENSAEVIKVVKERIEQIKQTLPEGVMIKPFLDRTKLVNTAIGTVTKNLVEGALIVIFILLLFLGNLRAGLIVASVIPLALLFAFAMMNLFGVSANLMSLGAIDFGLIVDGAVIIVEATMHHLGLLRLGRKLTQAEMNDEVYHSASKIRSSAAFGEIIILIVYLPILALVGTEGKMFGPMAQTVSFAILGAFILSLTYVPMVSALFLSKNAERKANFSDSMMAFFQRLYHPVIRFSMRNRLVVLIFSFALLVLSLVVFQRMGGEFIPTLEEGDFAVETRVITGSSLQNTIQATTAAEKILLEQFPEVEQVVSKIGAGEIPTDPMPVEAADLMIILKDRSEWTSAHNREALAEKMARALDVIPGVSFGFQQPIQMRFNELMTGVRQDVAVKIYGDDLDKLSEYAVAIGGIVNTVSGAADIYVEEVTGVPQVVINFKRSELAKYGLSISEVNMAIQTAYAGSTAGLVYEGEKRFDLVLRLQQQFRNDPDQIANLLIMRPDGHQIPLYLVAEVGIKEGAYQIQRDDTRRRIIVAFNVRDRDVESVVLEMKDKIEKQIRLEPGYSVSYGGQFENLVQARERLAVAVPLALLLIFVLLFFTFKSVKHSLLIFTAIPLSAIGGVLALSLRGMPFSISAGVGFIALFGVAVLNGIVLIGEFNRLKMNGVHDVFERIYIGTKVRLRPVLLTAAVASMGFLPMAISSSSGAEVQKPLATVVIGGLLSATLLTLIVLPVLYYYFEKGWKTSVKALVTAAVLFWQLPLSAQDVQSDLIVYQSLDEVIAVARENNPRLKVAKWQREQQVTLKASSWNLPKVEVGMEYGHNNGIYNNDSRFTISQQMAFPTVYAKQKQLANAKVRESDHWYTQIENELIRDVKLAWNGLLLAQAKAQLLLIQDSLFQGFSEVAALRLKTGESATLEKISAMSQIAEIKLMMQQNETDKNTHQLQLSSLLHTEVKVAIVRARYEKIKLTLDATDVQNNPMIELREEQVDMAKLRHEAKRAQALPDITFGYFNQSFNGPGQTIDGQNTFYSASDRFGGVIVGLSVPLFGLRATRAHIQAAEVRKKESLAQMQWEENRLNAQLKVLREKHQTTLQNCAYYEQHILPMAHLVDEQTASALTTGAIGYLESTQAYNQVLEMKLRYYELVNDHNEVVIEMEYVSGIN